MSDESDGSDGATAYKAEDIFSTQIEAVQNDLKAKRPLDFNSLSRSGKQAVIALVDEQRARLATENGRLVVRRRVAPSLMRYLTLGALD